MAPVKDTAGPVKEDGVPRLTITGKTKILGIIGSPIDHSLSPLMQNQALGAMGLDFVYVPFAVYPEALASAIEGLRSLNVVGFNVTIPHKTSVIAYLDDLSPEAALVGAVNTVKREGDRLIGYNTDCSGFLISLSRDLGFSPVGSRILVIGSGGAARAAVAGVCREGATSVTIANRSKMRAEQLVGDFSSAFPDVTFISAALDVLSSAEVLEDVDLVVNTTSVGMNGTSFDMFELSLLQTHACIYDMVYVPARTPLLVEAARCGLRTANGIGMLAGQGEAAFNIWTGVRPPAGMMMKALLDTVGQQ